MFHYFVSKVERFFLIKKLWNKSNTFWWIPELKRNVSIWPKSFETKPKHFDVFQNFVNLIFLLALSHPPLVFSCLYWHFHAPTGTFLALSLPQSTFLGHQNSSRHHTASGTPQHQKWFKMWCKERRKTNASKGWLQYVSIKFIHTWELIF